MFDYYGIDSGWPGKAEVARKIKNGNALSAANKAQILETATYNEISRIFDAYNAGNRFIPYIEMHEFEALLFSNADILAEKTGIRITVIGKIIEEYGNPEEINDDPLQTPGKRLKILMQGYQKVIMGKIVPEATGIDTIRGKCTHFNNWLTKLEQIRTGNRK